MKFVEILLLLLLGNALGIRLRTKAEDTPVSDEKLKKYAGISSTLNELLEEKELRVEKFEGFFRDFHDLVVKMDKNGIASNADNMRRMEETIKQTHKKCVKAIRDAAADILPIIGSKSAVNRMKNLPHFPEV
eukprot:Platyproteum_vivax@DN9151_c0_g1_i1.p1